MRILAVDLFNIFRASWEAHSGKNDQGTLAFRSTLDAIIKAREGFDRVAICCDSGPSFRKTIEPAYKAHRVRPPAAYGEQITRILERLRADGCSIFSSPVVVSDEYCAEADDVIASLVAWAAPQGHPVCILGNDKDLLALVADAKCSVQRLDGTIMTEADVVAKLGITPAQVPDWLALAGDGSDGFKCFPGEIKDGKRSPGIGDKTAVALLQAHKTALGVFDAIEDEAIGAHARAVLKRHGIEAAKKGLALATLRRDLPIDFSPLLAEPKIEPAAKDEGYFGDTAKPEPPEVHGEPVSAPLATKTTTALARVESTSTGIDRYAFQPRDLGQLWDTARALYNSRLYPQYGTPEAIMAIAIEAGERGIPIGLALRNGYVVKGRPAWSAGLLAALVLTSGKAEVFEIVESTSQRATLSYKRTGRPERTFTFTIEEAQHAGWLKSGDRGDSKWITNPRTMLRWAAMREAARAFFPDVVAGMHTPDELRDGRMNDDEWEHMEGAA